MINENSKKTKEEALLGKFKDYEDKKYIEMKTDEIGVDLFDEMFKIQNIYSGKSKNLLDKIGKEEGLLRNLNVHFAKGLEIKSKEDILYREEKFGKNSPIVKDPKTLYELIQECLEDPMLRILLVASVVSLLIGVAQEGWATGWIEGFSIFLAVFIVVSISSFNNLSKEKQFAKLNRENEKKMLNVRRNERKVEIHNEDVLVGDIIYLEIGNVIDVDCVILRGAVEVDESSLTGESEIIRKSPDKNQFLISGSLIKDGACEAVVCAVGVHSSIGKSKLQINDSDDKTPLQEKLTALADSISYFGIVLSILIFIVMVGKEVLIRLLFTGEDIFTSTLLDTIVNAFIISVTVTVVAIPEGLPMAVTIALAYSVLKMKEEQNLVRHLDASETMGNVNNICTDKTGTLTEGNMFVRSIFFEGVEASNPSKSNTRKNLPIFSSESLNNPNTQLFIRSIVNNITAYIEGGDHDASNIASFKGNSTECALLRLLYENKIKLDTYHESSPQALHRLPFKSENKYMASIYHNKADKYYSLYLKGAPEILLNFCNRYAEAMIGNINQEFIDKVLEKQNEYARRSERTLAFAYLEIEEDLFNETTFKCSADNVEEIVGMLLEKKNLIFVAMLGIADPPREDVRESINKCHSAGVYVRMVTGDNINTALSVAKEVGILDEYEYNLSRERIENRENSGQQLQENVKVYALEGSVFRKLSGGYREEKESNNNNNNNKNNKNPYEPENRDSISNPKEKKYVLNDPEKFRMAVQNLKVIARASPDDKFLLVLGLKELKNIVAVTGDGTNDAPALKKSDVGFAMGKKGTDIAKEASDIVLLNDSFSSVVTAIKYGRNVYDCIRKFIQFQLTTNVVAVFMTLLGGIVLKDAPLNAIQMLWVNLIMDSLASLALATEHPSDKLLERKPYPRDCSMITPSMMRNILAQSVFQIIILIIFLFYGDVIFDVPNDRDLSHFEWNQTNGYHFTLFFNIFVFLQVFNSINARKLEQHEVNVFENILGNNIYLCVQGIIVIGQIIMVQYGGRPLRTHPLTFNQHLACILIASTSLLVGYLSKRVQFFSQEKLPTEGEILSKMRTVSISLKEKLPNLPERGKSFRADSITNMHISRKK